MPQNLHICFFCCNFARLFLINYSSRYSRKFNNMKKFVVFLFTSVLVVNGYAKKPATIFLVGDETSAVLTQAEDVTETSAVGWGQVIQEYLPEGTVFENLAVDGATTKSFMDEGQWSEVLGRAKRKNILLVNFGHHEYDEEDYRHYSSFESFENNLMQMVKEAQKSGLTVVLLTPTAKCFYKDGEFHPRHGAYAEGVRRVAMRHKLPLIDLDNLTMAWIQRLGEEEAKKYFAADDIVRLNEEGAKVVAKMVADEAKANKVKGF